MRVAIYAVALAICVPALCVMGAPDSGSPVKLGGADHADVTAVTKPTGGGDEEPAKLEVMPASAGGIQKKWHQLEKKAGKMRAVVDKLEAARSVVESLRVKKKQADEDYILEHERYSLTGHHPTDHSKDKKIPAALEIATAKKNVLDMRFARAQAQEELLRREAVDTGAIPGKISKQMQNADQQQKKKIAQESKADMKKEKAALKEYKEFEKRTAQTKKLEQKLASQKTVQRALSDKLAGAAKAKAKQQAVELETAAVEAQTAQAKAELTAQQNAVLEYKRETKDIENQSKIQPLQNKLELAQQATRSEAKRADQATTALEKIQDVDQRNAEMEQRVKKMMPRSESSNDLS